MFLFGTSFLPVKSRQILHVCAFCGLMSATVCRLFASPVSPFVFCPCCLFVCVFGYVCLHACVLLGVSSVALLLPTHLHTRGSSVNYLLKLPAGFTAMFIPPDSAGSFSFYINTDTNNSYLHQGGYVFTPVHSFFGGLVYLKARLHKLTEWISIKLWWKETSYCD